MSSEVEAKTTGEFFWAAPGSDSLTWQLCELLFHYSWPLGDMIAFSVYAGCGIQQEGGLGAERSGLHASLCRDVRSCLLLASVWQIHRRKHA